MGPEPNQKKNLLLKPKTEILKYFLLSTYKTHETILNQPLSINGNRNNGSIFIYNTHDQIRAIYEGRQKEIALFKQSPWMGA